MRRELLLRIGIAVLVLLILFGAAVALFFAEGGEIYGVNHDPNGPAKPLPDSGIIFKVVDEEIFPIYDGRGIKSVEWWELPRKEIALSLITSPMAYIPPITASLLTLIFFLVFCFPLISLYQWKDDWKDVRPEQILTFLEENPGSSLQQIADELDFSRSAIRYHLHKMQKMENSMISATSYCGHLYYFTVGKSSTQIERQLCIILLREKEELVLTVIWEHPGITKRELTDHLRLTRTTCDWYLQRFLDEGLISKFFDGMCNHYQLTDEASDACKKNFAERAKTTRSDHPASGQQM